LEIVALRLDDINANDALPRSISPLNGFDPAASAVSGRLPGGSFG
jgi:hypothetical protein